MPKAGPPPWRKRKEPITDDILRASIDQAGGVYDANGHYAELTYAGCPTRERAAEIKQALYRSGKYVKVSVATQIVKADDGTFSVVFKAIDKAVARKYVLEKYGTDRSQWPYDPRARKVKE
jgi:hypothetical protein